MVRKQRSDGSDQSEMTDEVREREREEWHERPEWNYVIVDNPEIFGIPYQRSNTLSSTPSIWLVGSNQRKRGMKKRHTFSCHWHSYFKGHIYYYHSIIPKSSSTQTIVGNSMLSARSVSIVWEIFPDRNTTRYISGWIESDDVFTSSAKLGCAQHTAHAPNSRCCCLHARQPLSISILVQIARYCFNGMPYCLVTVPFEKVNKPIVDCGANGKKTEKKDVCMLCLWCVCVFVIILHTNTLLCGCFLSRLTGLT